MSLEDICAYISPETAWIGMKLGRGMGTLNEWDTNLLCEIIPGTPEKGADNYKVFRDKYHASVCHFCFTDFHEAWSEHVNLGDLESFSNEMSKISR